VLPLTLAFSAWLPAQSSAASDARAAEELRVSIWYVPECPVASPRFTWPPPRVEAAIDAHILAVRAWYGEMFQRLVVSPFRDRVEACGARVEYASPFAPAAIVTGTPAALRRVADQVPIEYLAPSLVFEPEQNISRMTVRADAVAALPTPPGPVTGKGVKVCVLEAQSVQQANPYTVKGVIYYQTPPSVPYARHPTAVAGIIAGQHTTYRGQAPGVTLLNANAGTFSEANILAATDWAVKQGANTINASFGSETSGVPGLMDRYFDHVVRNLNVNFIKGAGNNGTRTGYVVSPGLGYNSITVGNSRDQKTPNWWDDDVNPTSGYLDPTTGHPKPEIVAPGTSLTGNLDVSPWIGAIGTGGSYAGPQGNAAAALLMERDPNLKLWPEAIKAVLLATAWHRVETKLVGDRDGCGQLHTLAADAVVRQAATRLRYGNLTLKSFDAKGNFDLLLPVHAWSEVRAVVSWCSNPSTTYPYPNNPLQMDLDLIVLDPALKTVATATDRKRAFEIVKFLPATSGTYTFRLKKIAFAGTLEPYGLAVSQIHDTAVSAITGPATCPVGKTSMFTFDDPYHGGHAYVAAASLVGGGFDRAFLSGSLPVPLVPDALTLLILFGGGGIFVGYQGTLGGTGKATLQIKVPAVPALAGVSVTQAGLVLNATAPGGTAAVTPPLLSKVVP